MRAKMMFDDIIVLDLLYVIIDRAEERWGKLAGLAVAILLIGLAVAVPIAIVIWFLPR